MRLLLHPLFCIIQASFGRNTNYIISASIFLMSINLLLCVLQECDTYCYCFKTKTICNAKNEIQPFPSRVHPHSQNSKNDKFFEIAISNYNFTDTVLRYENVKDLFPVKKLTISGTSLTHIEVDCFRFNGIQLTQLDLANNKLRIIYDNTFAGLNLKILSLSRNVGMQLSGRSFYGLNVEILQLDGCGFVTLSYDVISFLMASGLQHLSIADNAMEQLDPDFETLFKKHLSISLNGNPFRCGCSIRWLLNYTRQLIPSHKNDQLFCSTPKLLAGKVFEDLISEELVCDKPQFRMLEIIFQSYATVKLLCSAIGNPPPSIKCYDQIRMLTATSDYDSEMLYKTVEVQFKATNDSLQCVASNTVGNTTVNLQITWPSRSVQALTAFKLFNNSSNNYIRNANNFKYTNNYAVNGNHKQTYINTQIRSTESTIEIENGRSTLFTKRFTLLELLVAILGTCVLTLTLTVLLCCLVKVMQRKKRKDHYNWNNITYGHPICSGTTGHEYDEPIYSQTSNLFYGLMFSKTPELPPLGNSRKSRM